MSTQQAKPALRRVVISAGGTGGHIFPGLALGQALQRSGVDVFWIGCDRELDRRLVTPHMALHPLPMKAWRGRGMWGRCRSVFSLMRSCWRSWRYFRRFSPEVVITFGGYITVPVGLAAKFLRIPLVIHEQNCVAGSANRLLASYAQARMCAFPGALPNSRVCGNPLRAGFSTFTHPAAIRSPGTVLRVLVMGGSLGAAAINDAMLELVSSWKGDRSLITIRHQTGEADFKRIHEAYAGFDVSVMAFVDDVLEALTWADVVISRSGALTVSEIAAVGVASILIPYPKAMDDHQFVNATLLGDCGAAMVLREKDLSAARLTDILTALAADPGRCQAMAEAAASVHQPGAIVTLMRVCGEVGERDVSFLEGMTE